MLDCLQFLRMKEKQLSKEQNDLLNLCFESYNSEHAEAPKDLPVMNNVIGIALSILEELGAKDIRQILIRLGLWVEISEAKAEQVAFDELKVNDEVKSFYLVTQEIFNRSVIDLKLVNQSLGNKNINDSITLSELYLRACGPFSEKLLAIIS